MRKTITLLTILLLVVFMIGCENSINPIEPLNGKQSVENKSLGKLMPGGGTIQAAINDPSYIDEVMVPDGIYTENITINRSLRLVSENGANSTTIVGKITVTADNVEISGFKITNPDGNYAIVSDGFDDLKISNNIISGIGNNRTSGNTHSIVVTSLAGAVSNVTIEDNIFSDIHGGENDPAISNGSASAIVIGHTNANFDVTGLVIQRNIITDVNASIVPWASQSKGGKGAYGIILSVGANGDGQIVNPQILNNNISDLEGRWAHAIGLEGDTPGAQVYFNDISYLTDYKDPSDAFAVFFEDNASASSVSVNYNNFSNLNCGVSVHPKHWPLVGFEIDATNNWWGHASGPGGATTPWGETTGRVNKKGKIIGKGVMVAPFIEWDPYLNQPIKHTKHNPLPPGLL